MLVYQRVTKKIAEDGAWANFESVILVSYLNTLLGYQGLIIAKLQINFETHQIFQKKQGQCSSVSNGKTS